MLAKGSVCASNYNVHVDVLIVCIFMITWTNTEIFAQIETFG